MMPTPNDAAALLSSIRINLQNKNTLLNELCDDLLLIYQRLIETGMPDDHALELAMYVYDQYQESHGE